MFSKSASVKFIFVTILLDAIGLGIVIPTLPDVVRRFVSDPTEVSQYFGYFISLYALMQFFASPVLGALSDRFGRRSILLISLFGAGVDFLLMAYAPNLWILFLGRLISGITGASMTVASSYMADISTDQNRAANFGMIGAAWGMGFIAGPLLGGLLGAMGPGAPFVAAAVMSFLNFLFGLFVLPESLPKKQRRHVTLSRLNPFISLYKVLKPSPVSVLVWAFFLMFMSGQVHPSIWTLYTEYRFQWSAFAVGLSLTFVGLTIAIVQGGLTRVIIPKLGESKVLVWGLWFNILGFACFGLATQGWMMYVVMAFSALGGLVPPAAQSLIARRTPPQEQGELQGSLMSMGSLTAILAPLLYTNLFAQFTNGNGPVELPGAPYLAAALISLIAWLMIKLKHQVDDTPVIDA
ncbi:MAG: TCR/Tet family MFS transporter [Bdellovibrionales bacterium]